jgi:2-amino-4-hydroxy-6-hydroxymethyldihydropteridine diphosphokinase
LKENKENNLAPILISVGSNINPAKNIPAAINLLAEIDDQILVSTIWESPAVGSTGPKYLNAAVLIHSSHSQEIIKSDILAPIESKLGRIRSEDKFADRTIDLDIIIYGETIADPEIWDYAHLALPASELLPSFKNIKTGETLKEVANRLASTTDIFPRLDIR